MEKNGIREIKNTKMYVHYDKNEFNKDIKKDQKNTKNDGLISTNDDSNANDESNANDDSNAREDQQRMERDAPLPGQDKHTNDPLSTHVIRSKTEKMPKYVTKKVCLKWKMSVVLN